VAGFLDIISVLFRIVCSLTPHPSYFVNVLRQPGHSIDRTTRHFDKYTMTEPPNVLIFGNTSRWDQSLYR
jgi:hypothetical protein